MFEIIVEILNSEILDVLIHYAGHFAAQGSNFFRILQPFGELLQNEETSV